MQAIGIVMATFILGGGVATLMIPPWIHSAMFIASVALQIRALIIEGSVLADNEILLVEVGELATR